MGNIVFILFSFGEKNLEPEFIWFYICGMHACKMLTNLAVLEKSGDYRLLLKGEGRLFLLSLMSL